MPIPAHFVASIAEPDRQPGSLVRYHRVEVPEDEGFAINRYNPTPTIHKASCGYLKRTNSEPIPEWEVEMRWQAELGLRPHGLLASDFCVCVRRRNRSTRPA